MKKMILFFFSICLFGLSACSDDDSSPVRQDDFKLEVQNGNHIAKPIWLKNIVDESKLPSGTSEVYYGINEISTLEYGGERYLSFGVAHSSDLCTASQFYKADGTKVECFSDLYNELSERLSEKKLLWAGVSYFRTF